MQDDIPWHTFNAKLLSDEQALTIKMNAITEWAALPATEMFLEIMLMIQIFLLLCLFGFMRNKNTLLLYQYLKKFKPDFLPTEDELHAVRFKFDSAPPTRNINVAVVK